ncbi:MAG: ergothioneine biosynthesis protein EgtB [Planctomycetota bacterium]
MTRSELASWAERLAASRSDRKPAQTAASAAANRTVLRQRFDQVRGQTLRLMAPLLADDFRIQTMADVSPPYWNLGHTSWLFDRSILRPHGLEPKGFGGLDYALNSYYEGLGARLPRERRGQVSSPSTQLVRSYRQAVDEAMRDLLTHCDDATLAELAPVVAICCQHEQQHQELFLTEIQHIRWSAPETLRRGYLEDADAELQEAPPRLKRSAATPLRGVIVPGDDNSLLGYQGRSLSEGGFCWDNELPAHRRIVEEFVFANRLVTNAEWHEFVADGGYQDPLLWLANGWAWCQQEQIEAPLYWQRGGSVGSGGRPHGGAGASRQALSSWQRFSLHGLQELDPHAPVCHVSFYEAEAFARWFAHQHKDSAWRTARLPREHEWEHAARHHGYRGDGAANLLDPDLAQSAFDVCCADPAGADVQQLAGDAWEWTMSHYEPYPGYQPFEGPLMEYNGKFMDNQRILRGGSFATPRGQARVAYRNFWAPTTRFQVTGVRLAADG